MKRASVALALCLSVACSSKKDPLLHVPSPAWNEQIVYFVMTDRFANGDPSNDDQHKGEFDPADGSKYSGGDLQGVIDKLDYIQGMGATAVWITPPVANMWWDPLQQSGGYHGYWARDLKSVDEHLGTLETYKTLSRELHKRGMYLIQDIVPNHMGNFFQYSSYDPNDVTKGFVKNTQAVPTSKPTQPPFDQDDVTDPAQRAAAIYHWTPAITDYSDPNQELNYQVSDLDDLNSENPVVRRALRDSYGYWIREVGVDAFRVDTAKYVPHDFWHDFFWSEERAAPGINLVAKETGRDQFFSFGEVFEVSDPMNDAADVKASSYQGTPEAPEMTTALGYPLYADIGRVFAGAQATSLLTYRLGRFMDTNLYRNPNLTPTFVDNHDVQRFLATGNRRGLAQALAFIFTIPGVPVVYYGTEQWFIETRQAMFKGGWKGLRDTYDLGDGYLRIQKLSKLRTANKVFTQGTLAVLQDNEAAPGVFACKRTLENDNVIVLLNSSDSQTLVSKLPTGLPGGTTFEVLYAEQAPSDVPQADASGAFDTVLPARAILILRAKGTATPPAPGATITVTTSFTQPLTDNTTVTGTVTPAMPLKMVLDGKYETATDVTPAADGSFSVVLPVADFPLGVANHVLAFYAPSVNVSTPLLPFTSDVKFTGQTAVFSDASGDDKGRSGTYFCPQDGTFRVGGTSSGACRPFMDVTQVTARVGTTTLYLDLKMGDWSTIWKPPLGFDHVAFSIFFQTPGSTQTVLPKLQASAPAGFTWGFNQFTYGWNNVMYNDKGATADAYGATVTPPKVLVDGPNKTVTFTYNRNDLGLSTWSGVQVYVTTWDFDGIGGNLRPLSPAGGQWTFGGGASTDPLIMDEVAPFTLP